MADHPVSVIEADVVVQKFSMTIRLKCFADELELLQGVEPLATGFYDPEELHDANDDHAQYLLDRVDVLDANGQRLEGKIVEIVPLDLPDEGVRQGLLMNYLLGYQFEYKFTEPPEFITIVQKLQGDGYLFPSEFKLLLVQAGSDTPNFQMMKPNQPQTFRMDWSKPALSSRASEKEWEAWFNEQRTQQLGITSYGSVYSFIYVTRFETRHELLIPLATLATLVDFQRADPSFLEIAEQDAAVKKIEEYFSQGNPVTIDGIAVQPKFDRIDFYGLDLRDFAVRSERKKISMASGRVGIIMSYPAKIPPKEVTVTWDLFNDSIRTVDSVVFGPLPNDQIQKTQFSMFLENNTYRWTSPTRLELPQISSVLAEIEQQKPPRVSWFAVTCAGVVGLLWLGARKPLGAATLGTITLLVAILAIVGWSWWTGPLPGWQPAKIKITPEQAQEIFSRLHSNIFRAFDYHQETDIYDALAASVDGPLLRELYLKMIKSLEVQEQGGAVARIDAVEVVGGSPADQPLDNDRVGFGYRCQWNLVGTIEHWGHIHQRTNRYDGDFEVELSQGTWKITKIGHLNNEEQGPVVTSLRQF